MSVHKLPVVPPCTVTFYLPGQDCLTSQPGDMVLIRNLTSTGFAKIPGALIRFGEWIRKSTRPYDWCDHSMTVVVGGTSPMVVQETDKGCVLTPLIGPPSTGSFSDDLYCVISPVTATQAQRDAAVFFANWTLGEPYGYWSLPVDAFDDVTGLKIALSTSLRMVCSANAARSAERWGLIPDRAPEAVRPGNLASYFNVTTKDTMQMYKQYLQQRSNK